MNEDDTLVFITARCKQWQSEVVLRRRETNRFYIYKNEVESECEDLSLGFVTMPHSAFLRVTLNEQISILGRMHSLIDDTALIEVLVPVPLRREVVVA